MAMALRAGCSAVRQRGAAQLALRTPKGALAVRRMGSDMRPPFKRSPAPSQPLHEEHELIWDDGVAPEVALDFDAPYISRALGLKMFLGGFAFFASIYAFASVQPYGTKMAVIRGVEGTMLPFGGAHVALGRDPDEVPEVEETTQTFEEGHADAHGHDDEDDDDDDDDE